MRILVTAFEAFGTETLNPSQKILEQFDFKNALDSSHQVITKILPVSYQGSTEELQKLIEANGSFDLALFLGQAGGNSKVHFERVAINVASCLEVDNDGICKIEECLSKDGPDGLMTTLNISGLTEALKKENQPVEISNSAGTYVCNALYYFALKTYPQMKSLFIHWPYLPEQALGKKVGTAFLPLETMLSIFKTTLTYLIQNSRQSDYSKPV